MIIHDVYEELVDEKDEICWKGMQDDSHQLLN